MKPTPAVLENGASIRIPERNPKNVASTSTHLPKIRWHAALIVFLFEKHVCNVIVR
jgi:hypothetical protein